MREGNLSEHLARMSTWYATDAAVRQHQTALTDDQPARTRLRRAVARRRRDRHAASISHVTVPADGTKISAVASRVSSPRLVGRARELAIATGALAEMGEGATSGLVIGGEAGVGKTRLLAELLDHARHRGALTLTGGCIDLGEATLPFGPIVEALPPAPATSSTPPSSTRSPGPPPPAWAASSRARAPTTTTPTSRRCACSSCSSA